MRTIYEEHIVTDDNVIFSSVIDIANGSVIFYTEVQVP